MSLLDRIRALFRREPHHAGRPRQAATVAKTGPDRIQDALLVPELAEVYLLLDNISAVASKQVPDLGDDPVFSGSRATWIQQICDIRWPPDPAHPQDNSLSAAKLIRAKDALNSAAAPASGNSIAFTLMLSGDSRPGRSPRSWWQRLLGIGRDPDIPEPRFDNPRDRLCSGESFTQVSLAVLAYPVLARSIGRNRFYYNFINGFLLVALGATCLLSWDVASGSAMLNRVNSLKTIQGAAPQKDVKAQNATTAAAAGGSSATDLQVPLENLQHWVEANTWLGWLVGGHFEKASVSSATLVAGAVQVNIERCRALYGPPLPGHLHATARRIDCRHYVFRRPPTTMTTNVEWAAVFIGVLAGTVLPICYGVLGAAAAVVRTIVARMSASTLMPRDLVLALVQLALGAVIGACVGLFVTSDGNGAAGDNGLLGPVHLSGAALCFLAGFGVEGVFRALESLVARVFPVGSTAPRPVSAPVVAGRS